MKILKSSMNWINKHFFKKEYNYTKTETMEAVKNTAKIYQWKKGENFGKVVEVKERNEKHTFFTDGTQIFNNVLSEFMEEVIDGRLPFPGADLLNSISMGEKPLMSFQQTTVENKKPNMLVESNVLDKKQSSPLEELVAKLSKKNIEALPMTINLNIPNKQIFEMLIDNADEDKENLIDTIANVAVSQIEINKLQEYLKDEVITFINKYYND